MILKISSLAIYRSKIAKIMQRISDTAKNPNDILFIITNLCTNYGKASHIMI